MPITMSRVLIVAALFLTTVSTVAGFMVSPGGYLAPLASPDLLGATGGITGSISISPVSPVCGPTVGAAPAPSYYSNSNDFGILVIPLSGPSLTIPVNWVLEGGCEDYGTFNVQLNPGVYSLILAWCASPHAGGIYCPAMPKTVIVESGAWTHIEIAMSRGTE